MCIFMSYYTFCHNGCWVKFLPQHGPLLKSVANLPSAPMVSHITMNSWLCFREVLYHMRVFSNQKNGMFIEWARPVLSIHLVVCATRRSDFLHHCHTSSSSRCTCTAYSANSLWSHCSGVHHAYINHIFLFTGSYCWANVIFPSFHWCYRASSCWTPAACLCCSCFLP